MPGIYVGRSAQVKDMVSALRISIRPKGRDHIPVCVTSRITDLANQTILNRPHA